MNTTSQLITEVNEAVNEVRRETRPAISVQSLFDGQIPVHKIKSGTTRDSYIIPTEFQLVYTASMFAPPLNTVEKLAALEAASFAEFDKISTSKEWLMTTRSGGWQALDQPQMGGTLWHNIISLCDNDRKCVPADYKSVTP